MNDTMSSTFKMNEINAAFDKADVWLFKLGYRDDWIAKVEATVNDDKVTLQCEHAYADTAIGLLYDKAMAFRAASNGFGATNLLEHKAEGE